MEKPESQGAAVLSAAAISALQTGNKIEAIKIVRVERNIGLKEAKDAVEEYVQTQPVLKSAFVATQARMKQAALRWLAIFIGLAILAVYYLARR